MSSRIFLLRMSGKSFARNLDFPPAADREKGMQTKDSTRFRKARQVNWKSVEGEAVVLHLATGNYFALDPVGTFLWSKVCRAPKSLADLIDAVMVEYTCSKEQARKDTLEFCGQLVAEKLLEIKE